MPFLAFSTGHFPQINMQDYAKVSCLLYSESPVLIMRYSFLKEKKDVLPHRLTESDFSSLQLRQSWPAGHCLVLRSIRFSQNLHIFSMIL